jgi:predicted GNAT superfamily acetyltransferase
MTGIDLRPADEAVSSAEAAAYRAGVVVRELAGIDELNDTVHLLSDIWGRTGNPPVTPELLRAFSKAGNYIGGAFDGETLVGATIAFHSTPERHSLHSHIAGVAASMIGRSVGFAMKLHQRAWALDRGIGTIEWTFDPLVARNAYFNIVKLGADPAEYLTNFYGVMSDVINGDDETDRLLVRWALTDPVVVSAAVNGRVPATQAGLEGHVAVAVPTDIEGMRVEEPELAHEWRVRVRERLTDLLGTGGRIVGFDRVQGYIVRPGEGEVAL